MRKVTRLSITNRFGTEPNPPDYQPNTLLLGQIGSPARPLELSEAELSPEMYLGSVCVWGGGGGGGEIQGGGGGDST